MGAPVVYVVVAPRTSELVAWLRCNDVDPRDVPYKSEVFIGTDDGVAWFVEFDAYVRSEIGAIKYDLVTETFAYDVCRVPLVNDPPMGWLKEAAPRGSGPLLPAGAETAAGEDTVAESVPCKG
jgi:hypothetical protein